MTGDKVGMGVSVSVAVAGVVDEVVTGLPGVRAGA